MIPLKDENPTRIFPIVTVCIIAINALVFLYELSLGRGLEDFIFSFGLIPYDLINLRGVGPLLTLITSLFLHGGFMHIIGNMLYLWVFGNNIEDKLGHTRFIFFYLACGLAASLGQVMTNPGSKLPMIGASGAVSGVLGAYLLLYPRAKVLVLVPMFYLMRIVRLEAFWFLIFWIALQFFYGTASYALMDTSSKGGVAWFAHIFGFFGGMVFLGLFLRSRRFS